MAFGRLLLNSLQLSRGYVTAALETATTTSPKRLITCKNKELNLNAENYRKHESKFGSIPLASKGWLDRRAKGDFFVLHPMANEDIIEPESSFESLGINSEIATSLRQNSGIETSTEFQAQAIPLMSNNEHVLLAEETGCGKTLAFLLPILQNIKELKERGGQGSRRFNTPLALVLTPGRELATQISQVAEGLGKNLNISVKTILGGHTKQLMMNPSFDDVDVLIGTVGAISKLVTTGIYRMEHVRHVVLDEADTLLDDSFNEKLAYFLRRFPFHKNLVQSLSKDICGTQLILVSATMPNNYQDLFKAIIDTKTIKEVKGRNLHKLIRRVPQRFFRVNKSDRPSHLLGIVKSEAKKNDRPVIVFSNRTPTADFVSLMLNEAGVECVNLTGDMLVQIRLGRFERFQSGEVNVLSTTDVGSRGLDTRRAAHIINFDFPLHVSDYIHRCGRVGRVGGRTDCVITNLISSGRELNLVQRIEHSARTGNSLHDVDANITNIIKQRIMKNMGEAE